jgi:HPr kinase/phosphorylase
MTLLRNYLTLRLAQSTSVHGVCLDVLGMGVIITGDSGSGKSELGLELISRGAGLVADDVVDIYRIGPDTLQARCPTLLRDFLEVRGLGVLNIRTIFGETSVRPNKNVRLIIHLASVRHVDQAPLERLPLNASVVDILGVKIAKVTIPVAPGRNLAVLVEAAVRNTVLQLRGIDSNRELAERQAKMIAGNE